MAVFESEIKIQKHGMSSLDEESWKKNEKTGIQPLEVLVNFRSRYDSLDKSYQSSKDEIYQ